MGKDLQLTFRTLLRRKSSGVFQRLVRQRGQVEPVLVVVGQPGARRHGENGFGALHGHAEQLDGLRTQVTGSGVAQVTGDLIENSSK